MAETLTGQRDVTVSFPIVKTEKTADGDLLVYGKVTDGSVDSDEQIIDPKWSGKALQDWLETGANLRVQHNPHRDPAGVGLQVDVDRDGDGAHWLKALVVEPVAKRLVEKGALRAFSVGIMRPKIVTHMKARGGMILGGDFGEVSLVDRPANKNCTFSIVKADKSGAPELTGTLDADAEILQKMLQPTPADVAKVLSGHAKPQQVQQGFIPDIPAPVFADPVARRLNEALNVEKRDVSTEERSRLAQQGEALPDGSFPIANVGDLKNAIRAIGRAKNPGKARKFIMRRARAMGKENLIPESWKGWNSVRELSGQLVDELFKAVDEGVMPLSEAMALMTAGVEAAKAAGTCKTCGGKGTIRGGTMKCPDCGGKDKPPMEEKTAKPPMADADDDDGAGNDGGGSDHDEGRDSDADDNMKPVSKKGAKPVKSGKRRSFGGVPQAGGEMGQAEKPQQVIVDPSMTDNDASGRGGPGGSYTNNKSFACSECGTSTYKGASFCSGCGAAFKGMGGNDPAAGVKGKKGTKRLPKHREPDGAAVESFEHDSGIHTDPDKGGASAGVITQRWTGSKEPVSRGSAIMDGNGTIAVGGGNSTSVKMEDMPPYAIVRAHDAFCPAWSMKTVYDEYASLASLADAINIEELREAAMKSVASGQFDAGEDLLLIARQAEVLAGIDKGILEDARAGLHKNFTAMYPSVHLSPGDISPGQFKRPYISAGHAPLSAQPPGSEPPAKLPPEAPDAEHFTRGPITEGHEAPSPGNKSDAARVTPKAGFSHASPKGAAQVAMEIIHDRLASKYQHLCPIDQSDHGTPSPVGKTVNVSDGGPVRKSATIVATKADDDMKNMPGKKGKGKKGKGKGKKGKKAPRMDMSDMQKVLKTQLSKTLKTLPSKDELAALAGTYKEQLEAQQRELGELRELVNKVGSEPDPRQAPHRGISINGMPGQGSGGATAVERRSLIDEAVEKQRAERLQLAKSWAASGDPIMREMGEDQIRKLLTAP